MAPAPCTNVARGPVSERNSRMSRFRCEVLSLKHRMVGIRKRSKKKGRRKRRRSTYETWRRRCFVLLLLLLVPLLLFLFLLQPFSVACCCCIERDVWSHVPQRGAVFRHARLMLEGVQERGRLHELTACVRAFAHMEEHRRTHAHPW